MSSDLEVVKYRPKLSSIKVMSDEQFNRLFKLKKMGNLWYCFGTWNGTDFSHEAKKQEDARVEMWQILARIGFVETTGIYESKYRFQLNSTSIIDYKKAGDTGGAGVGV